MNSADIYDLVEQIAATPGKNDKIALVTANIGDETFRQVLVYTYNPFKTYGTRLNDCSWTDYAGAEGQFDEATWQLLIDLAARRLTGHNARDAIAGEFKRLNRKSAELLSRVILKDLRAGFSESTVNKASKGLIPSFSYMRCSLPKNTDLDKWDWGNGIISQEKADGMFVNVSMLPTGVFMFSRQGTPLPSRGFEGLLGELHERFDKDQQLHGELLVKRGDEVLAREIGNGMLNKVIKGGNWEEGCYPTLHVWDAVPLSMVEKGACPTPYSTRLRGIHAQLKAQPGIYVSLIPTRMVKSLKEAYAHYRELLLEGKEGTIIKKPTMIWRDGTSKDQIKLKLEAPCELVVIGLTQGAGKNEATFGALLCRSACGQLEVAVGTGFDDASRKMIHDQRDQWIGAIVTVKANGIMYSSDPGKKPHSLFLPVFVEGRDDKMEADDLARIEEQFDNAVNLAGEAA